LLTRAYLEDCGCWANGLLPGGGLDSSASWSVYAELDQFAWTLALHERRYAQILPKTFGYWFGYFVDKEFGEVWNGVDLKTHSPIRQMPKQWAWKNAYHSFEHALVGYIVAQQLNNLPVTLYYAFPGDALPAAVEPYYFSGDIKSTDLKIDNQGQPLRKIVFSNVH
jgi:hypothetical protein